MERPELTPTVSSPLWVANQPAVCVCLCMSGSNLSYSAATFTQLRQHHDAWILVVFLHVSSSRYYPLLHQAMLCMDPHEFLPSVFHITCSVLHILVPNSITISWKLLSVTIVRNLYLICYPYSCPSQGCTGSPWKKYLPRWVIQLLLMLYHCSPMMRASHCLSLDDEVISDMLCVEGLLMMVYRVHAWPWQPPGVVFNLFHTHQFVLHERQSSPEALFTAEVIVMWQEGYPPEMMLTLKMNALEWLRVIVRQSRTHKSKFIISVYVSPESIKYYIKGR